MAQEDSHSGIYRPLIEDMTWSYSRVSAFEDCPYRWFLRYIAKEEEAPMFYSSYGKFAHRLFQMYYLGVWSRLELSERFLLGFSESVLGERPSDATVKKYIADGVACFSALPLRPMKTVAVEDEIRFTVRGKPFICFVDYIGSTDKGLCVVDHKSRSIEPGAETKKRYAQEVDENFRQLNLYAEAVRQKYGRYPETLAVNYFRTGNFVERQFDESAVGRTLDEMRKQIAHIETVNSFPPDREYFKCRWICGYHDRCVYWNNR